MENDGYRAQLVCRSDGRVLLRSRKGTNLTAAFPEIADAALAQLPGDTGLDGELVVWEGERLAFERLHQRMVRRRGAGALAAARTWPAHLVTGARTGSGVARCGRNAASRQVNGTCSTRHPMA
ncbi:hypothetical protein PEM37_38320 [Streptomyces sp. AD681]|nr:hypothetical protein [Streptomyces sp. AD681]MDA5147371.1 hypothetical protein [Streptomyces sp. AD681]